ncbi:MAG: hypothetical protein Q9183_000794 [Haloplaca sp. 2 TL-2023]
MLWMTLATRKARKASLLPKSQMTSRVMIDQYFRQVLDLAEIFNKNESKSHIEGFRGSVYKRQDAMAKLVQDEVDKIMDQDKKIKALSAKMLTASRLPLPEPTKVPLAIEPKGSMQGHANSILRSFNELLDDYHDLMRATSGKGSSVATLNSNQLDRENLASILQIQYAKTRQNVRNHMCESTEIPGVASDASETGTEVDGIWSSLASDGEGPGLTVGERRHEWERISKSASRGVRRIIQGFPTESTM